MRSPTRLAWFLAAAFAAVASQPALAQDEEENAPKGPPAWQLEIFGGGAFNTNPGSGAGSLPTSGSIIGGRLSLSSLYFGAGAQLFNQIAGGAGRTIVPLDPVLNSLSVQRPDRAVTFGLRLSRDLGHRFNLEFSGEFGPSDFRFRSSALAGIEASRASYIPGMTAAVAAVPSGVTSVVAFTPENAQQIFTTAVIEMNLKTTGSTIPYILGGAGTVFNLGDTPTAKITGQVQLGNPAQIFENDVVTLRYAVKDRVVVGVAGGGVKYSFASRWGLRLDGRAHLYGNKLASLVDAAPAIALSSTGAPFPLLSAGSLQFSTTSPMNGVAITGYPTFVGSGIQMHISATVGLFLKF